MCNFIRVRWDTWLANAGLAIPGHFAYVTLERFVVMPNHIHGILILHPTVGAQQCCVPTRVKELFDDDAQEFFLAGTQEKFTGLAEIDIFTEVFHSLFVDFYSALFDQPLRLAFRWHQI